METPFQRAAWVIALSSALVACGRPKPAPLPAVTERPLEELAFAGCDAIVSGPACELGDPRELRVWLPATAMDVSFRFRDTTLESRAEDARDGVLRTARVPEGIGELQITTRDREGRSRWTIRIAAPPARPAAVLDADAEWRAGSPANGATKIASALPTLVGVDRAIALSTLARLELARGDRTAASARFEEAIAAEEAAGRRSAAADDAEALAFILRQERRFREGHAVLDRTRPMTATHATGRAFHLYFDGLLARDEADARTALRELTESELQLARLGLAVRSADPLQARALTLLEIGRARDAYALLAGIDPRTTAAMGACDRATVLVNLGWAALHVAHDGGPTIDPRPPLERALAEFRGECADPREVANVLENLALAALDTGDVALARARSQEGQREAPTPDASLAFWWLDLDARIALASGAPAAALASYDRLDRFARLAGSPDDAWIAADGRAEALSVLGRREAALDAAAEAVRLLDEASRAVTFGEGRGTFLRERERSVVRHVELLLALGRVEEAFAATRASHARLVAEVQRTDRIGQLDPAARGRWEDALGAYRRARDAIAHETEGDWSLSRDNLARVVATRHARDAAMRASLEDAAAALPHTSTEPPPLALAAREIAIAYAPLRSTWVAFVAEGASVRVVALPPVDPGASREALAAALLEPLRASIARADLVRVLPARSLERVDLHALPWDGAPLVASHAVVYALDVPDSPSAPNARALASLVVADPSNDLPSARREADSVAATLSAGAFGPVARLDGRAARREDVLAHLATSTLFHYAGHGVFAGLDGAESALPLADGALTIGDILVLPRAPSRVVLSGCETARAHAPGDERSGGDALGLAQAFLAAGSDHVVAATRVVDDAAAAALMSALYKQLANGLDFPNALRGAEIAAAHASPPVNWAAFRVLRR